MDINATATRYRITAIHPWTSEKMTTVPDELTNRFMDHEGTMDTFHAIAATCGAQIESAELGGVGFQVVINWKGHRYDMDMEPVR